MKNTLCALLLILAPSPFASSQMRSSSDDPGQLARDQYVNISRRALQLLETDLDKLQFSLDYHGPEQDQRSLYLSVEPPPEKLPATHRRARISREQAAMIIGHLAGDGYLYRGTINSMKQIALPKEPYYLLTAKAAQDESYFEFIPCTEQPYSWHGVMRPAILEQMKSLRAALTGEAGAELDKLSKTLEAQPCSLPANLPNTERQNQTWQSVVYAFWDRTTGTSSLRVHDFVLQESRESREFVFGSLWRYNVSLKKWERVNLRVDHPIVLKAEKRQVYSAESDQKIVSLTADVGLFWVEWKEDNHSADTLIFAGMLCEDVDIGNPPAGMIATCVPFRDHAQAMFVPDPRIRSRQ